MKKIFSFLVLVSFLLWGAGLAVLPASAQEAELETGSIVKTEDSAALYYLAEDGKLYVFPNANTYFSWFDDFTNITVITDEEFGEFELGGSVYYQPGSLLVKTPTSLKVYAVGINGELRWIETEELAKQYYGENWNQLVDDVPDSFFVNYRMGESIDQEDDFDPTEVEEEVPTISHNKGFKAKERVMNRIMDKTKKRCEYLKRSVNKLQKRAERWGIEMPTIGDDYIQSCSNVVTVDDVDEDNDGEPEGDMVYVCKRPPGNHAAAHTIYVSKNALKAHLKNGSTIGRCGGDDDSNDDSDDDSNDDSDEEDVTAPVISNLEANPSTSTAIITWDTDEAADSELEYDVVDPFTDEESVDESDLVTEHELMIEGLEASTTYYYFVSSSDADGNEATTTIYSFTTLSEDEVVEEDTTAPEISDIEAVESEGVVTITWNTDEEADSKVVYALESINASTTVEEVSDSGLVTSHSLELSGLATSTMYYFYVESSDEAGNTAKSEEESFETVE